MLFLAQEPPSDDSLVESAVRHIEAQPRGGGEEAGRAFLVVTFGANDLFSYRQIVVASPEVAPAEFERDLRRLDASTAKLTDRGVRRIYVFPPPVEAAFDHHRLPDGVRFTDGELVPSGSRTLLHWWQAAVRGRRIPRQVVLSESQLEALRKRQDAFFDASRRILGVESNWLVVDTRDVFLAVLERIYRHGIWIDGVPGYGTLSFSGSNAVVSTDSIHPTPFGYLLWAEMALERLREAGVELVHDDALPPGVPRVTADRVGAVLRRAAEEVRRAPSFFRPCRFPLDSDHDAAIARARREVEDLDETRPGRWADAYRRTSWIWPYVPEYLIEDTWEAVRRDSGPPPALHHEAVAELRRVFEVPDDQWSVAMRAAYRDLVIRFVGEGTTSALRHSGFSRSAFAALGRQDDHMETGFSEGHTPGFIDLAPRLTVFGEASAAGVPRTAGSAFSARASFELIPYRTPLAYLPLGVTDFFRIEGRIGLGVVRSMAPESGVPSTSFEASLTPLGVAAFVDAWPNLVVSLAVPSWRPLFGVGESCSSFAHCSALARFSAGVGLSWWPNRDPAFNAGPAPYMSLYASFRALETFGDTTLPLANAHLEGGAGLAIGF